MPRKLRRDLPEFFIRTAQQVGYSGFKNGELLGRAGSDFDVLLTIDQRIQYQQDVSKFNIGVVAIELPDTRLVFLRALLTEIRDAIDRVKPGEIIVVRPTSA